MRRANSSRTPKRDKRRARTAGQTPLERLYRAAFEFANDRNHFAPGQYTMFVPRKGTTHYAEHLALTEAAVVFANTDAYNAVRRERDALKKEVERLVVLLERSAANTDRAIANTVESTALLKRCIVMTENLTRVIKEKL